MRKILSILAGGMLVLFFSGGINAFEYSAKTESVGVDSMLQAIKYAETAKTHKAHPEHILKNAEKSLEYAKKAEIETIELGSDKGRAYITDSIRHLVEAISSAKMGHTDIASEHITDALEEMHQFTSQ
jgi:hypothetical protein